MLGKVSYSGGGLNGLPEFTYTGSYTLKDDGNKNWSIEFTTSGALTFSKLGTGKGLIDLFGVGGGAGGLSQASSGSAAAGGGSGYTKSVGSVLIEKKQAITIAIGNGGSVNSNGTATTVKTSSNTLLTANGGNTGSGGNGGNGGSGGGSSGVDIAGGSWGVSSGGNGGNGGSNGSNGGAGSGGYNHKDNQPISNNYSVGRGQGYPTTAFYELGVEVGSVIYAPGGAGAATSGGWGGGSAGTRGAGDTHGAGGNASGSGFAGICIIRNHRGVN